MEKFRRYCLRRMECGRIFGHMRFEALKSRSFPVVDAYSSWIHWHPPAAGGGYIVFLILLKRKIDVFRVVQNRQISIKIHSKPFKIDKNSLQTAQKSTFVATRVMWAAHESCFLFILVVENFLRSRLDKCGILWYNISIMGSIHPFVAAPFYYWLLLAAAAYALLLPGVGPDPCQIHAVDFSIWQKINLLLLERREHK